MKHIAFTLLISEINIKLKPIANISCCPHTFMDKMFGFCSRQSEGTKLVSPLDFLDVHGNIIIIIIIII